MRGWPCVRQQQREEAEPRDLRDLHTRIDALDLADAEPELPVEDREADTWEPLVAIADATGGDWPDRAHGLPGHDRRRRPGRRDGE